VPQLSLYVSVLHMIICSKFNVRRIHALFAVESVGEPLLEVAPTILLQRNNEAKRHLRVSREKKTILNL